MTTQRSRPDWDSYFINLAQAISMRSTCIRRTYGAIIVNDRAIVATGYNGAARGEPNCIDTQQCVREQMNVPKGERYELCVAIHAEANAIISAPMTSTIGATIYIAGRNSDGTLASGQPCLMCARMITNAKIAKLVYLNEDGEIITVDY